MTQYAIRRLLAAIPVVIGVLIVTFVLARAIPGEPCTAMFGEKATPEVCAIFNAEKGLDKPLTTQFLIFARDMLRGDFGDSIRFKRPVMQILIERLPQTIELGVAAVIMAISIGIPLGIISALKRNSPTDVATMIGANIGVSMPVFWLGLMLAYVFSITFKDTLLWLPPSGRLTAGLQVPPLYAGWETAPEGLWKAALDLFSNLYVFNALVTGNLEVLSDALRHLILPALALGTIPMSLIARITRSSMLEVLGQDYVRTARAKGARPLDVVMRHAFRNALLPLVTVVGLSFGSLLSGAVLTESIFALPGMGRILYEAITARDYVIVQGFTLVVAVVFVVINLITDLTYGFLDPRIRLS